MTAITAEMTAWYEKLLRVNNTILLWENVQGKLVYFLPIFTCKDFLKEIPHETSIWQVNIVVVRTWNLIP